MKEYEKEMNIWQTPTMCQTLFQMLFTLFTLQNNIGRQHHSAHLADEKLRHRENKYLVKITKLASGKDDSKAQV